MSVAKRACLWSSYTNSLSQVSAWLRICDPPSRTINTHRPIEPGITRSSEKSVLMLELSLLIENVAIPSKSRLTLSICLECLTGVNRSNWDCWIDPAWVTQKQEVSSHWGRRRGLPGKPDSFWEEEEATSICCSKWSKSRICWEYLRTILWQQSNDTKSHSTRHLLCLASFPLLDNWSWNWYPQINSFCPFESTKGRMRVSI